MIYNFIDTHCHLYSKILKNQIDDVILRSKKNGINKIYMPNIDLKSINPMLEVKKNYPEICFPMVGLHPCEVKKNYKNVLTKMETYLKTENFYAIGETGLDLYWNKSLLKEQEEAFRIQISWAKRFNLPLVIHSRNAFSETMKILEEENNNNIRGVFHCFGGSKEEAERIIDLGFYLGIGGIVTFKNSILKETLKKISLNNIVLETDSPYLSPVPYRGKTNEPSYIIYIAEEIAKIKEVGLNEVSDHTNKNTNLLFRTY